MCKCSYRKIILRRPQLPETTRNFFRIVFARFWVSKGVRKTKILRSIAYMSLSPWINIPKQGVCLPIKYINNQVNDLLIYMFKLSFIIYIFIIIIIMGRNDVFSENKFSTTMISWRLIEGSCLE